MQKIDFLRHIVNRMLAEKGAPKQIVDDVRKIVGKAEDKYKFSSFGGDVRNLAEFIQSRDFDDLIAIFKSVGSIDILVEILKRAKEAYKDYPNVVAAIESRLKELTSGVEDVKARIEAAYNMLKTLEDKGYKVEYDKDNLRVRLKRDGVDLEVKYDTDKKCYKLKYEIKGELSASSYTHLASIAREIDNFVRRLRF